VSKLVLKNGTLDVNTLELAPHSPANMLTRFVDVEYAPGKTCPEWLKMLDSLLGDRDEQTRADIIELLQEWTGVALIGGAMERTPRALRKALFLYGPQRSGKSTFLEMITRMVGGSSNIVAAPVRDVTKQFGMEQFTKAAAWVTEEVAGMRYATDTSRIKCVITGEPVTVGRKYLPDATLRFRGPVAWAGNTRPNFPEQSGAIYDRIITLSLDVTFTPAEAKKQFGALKPIAWLEAKGELPGVLNWALEGYKRLLARGHYRDAEIKDLEQASQAMRVENDGLFAFIKDCTEPRDGVFNGTRALAWAAKFYIKDTRDEFEKLQSLMVNLRQVVPEVYPSVRVTRPRVDDGEGQERRAYVYHGLALNKRGQAYLEKAKSESDIAAKDNLVVNQLAFGKPAKAEP
jgi:P4 family phage/plasmid primase-like protien